MLSNCIHIGYNLLYATKDDVYRHNILCGAG